MEPAIQGVDSSARSAKPEPMNSIPHPWPGLIPQALGMALALGSCADSAKEPPASPPVATRSTSPAAKPESKKPVRMNGRGTISTISLGDFFALQQSGTALILDARPSFFYHLGHIPGAVNLPKNRCDEAIAAREATIKTALAAGKSIVVYCSSSTCPDARSVAIHLSGFGYPSRIFTGGWEAWREADMPGE